MRNSKCAADAERPGNFSGSGAQLMFDQTGRRNAARAFDKCSVLEIKNSALFLGIADSDIKDIKRRRTLSARPDQSPDARCERPEQDVERRSACLIIDYFQEIKNSADFLAIAAPDIKQIKQIKRAADVSPVAPSRVGGTLSALPDDARCGARDTPSNALNLFKRDPGKAWSL